MYAPGFYSQEAERKIEKNAFLFRHSENLLGYSLNFCKKNTLIIVIYKIPKKEQFLKWYCDENHIFPIEPILKHKQVASMTRKMLFTIFKYLFSFQRYLSF